MIIKDFSVSNEIFELKINPSKGILQTTPVPENLSTYYESEDYISHTDAKRTFIEKLYHLVRKRALSKKVFLVKSLFKNAQTISLLDIGSGTGDFLKATQGNNINAIGFEPNPKARAIAQSKKNVLVDDIYNLPDASVDVITLWHVLEHIPDIEAQLKEFSRLLKPSGYIVVAVPNYQSFDASYYKEYWAAYDVPRHIWHFSKSSITLFFNSYSFNLCKVLPMWFDSFYVSMLSEKYKTGTINYIKAITIGLLSNTKGLFSKEYSSHIYVFKKQ